MTGRRVSFNTRNELGDKIDKLAVVMSKLAAKDSHERKPFNLFIAYGLGLRPLLHLYIYVIGLGPRPSYIFSFDKDSM